MEGEVKGEGGGVFKWVGMDLSRGRGIFYGEGVRCDGVGFEVKVEEGNGVRYGGMEGGEKGEDMYGGFDRVGDVMEGVNG